MSPLVAEVDPKAAADPAARIFLDVARTNPGYITSVDHTIAALADWFSRKPLTRVWIAYADATAREEPVGVAALAEGEPPYRDLFEQHRLRPTVEICRMAVTPAGRGRGVASALLETATAAAAETHTAGWLGALAGSVAAHMYQRRDWTPLGVVPSIYHDPEAIEVHFKVLQPDSPSHHDRANDSPRREASPWAPASLVKRQERPSATCDRATPTTPPRQNRGQVE